MTLEAVTLVTPRSPVEELKVKLLPLLGAIFPVASVANNGKQDTAEWAKSVVSNMAREPKGNDRAQIMAVAAGEADIAVANTYYLALIL